MWTKNDTKVLEEEKTCIIQWTMPMRVLRTKLLFNNHGPTNITQLLLFGKNEVWHDRTMIWVYSSNIIFIFIF